MTLAMQLAIDFGLKDIGLRRIRAITGHENIKAKKLLETLRFNMISDVRDEEVEYEIRQNIPEVFEQDMSNTNAL